MTDYIAGFVTVSATEGGCYTNTIYPEHDETFETMCDKVKDAMAVEMEFAKVNVIVTGSVRRYGDNPKSESFALL